MRGGDEETKVKAQLIYNYTYYIDFNVTGFLLLR